MDDNLVNSGDKIFFLPVQDKPIKIVFEELLCPVAIDKGDSYRCKFAKSKLEDMNFIIYCSAEKCNNIKFCENKEG